MLFFPPLTKKESTGSKAVNEKYGHLPPLGMAHLAASLLEKGFTVDVVEPLVEKLSEEDILERIRKNQPKVVGMSALTPTFNKSVSIAKKIRTEFPNLISLIGGTHITLSYRDATSSIAKGVLDDHSWFDIACVGEGEITLTELMTFFQKHKYNRDEILKNVSGLKTILGVVYREKGTEGKGIFTGTRPFVDLDDLPIPARQFLPMEKYIPFPIQYRRLPVVHMFVSRGCPWNCSFCCTPFTWGRSVRFRSPENVVKEIKHVMDKYGAKEISFWDDTFTANAQWLTKLCDLIQEEKLDIIWSCFARANDMKPKLAQKMKDGGCWEVFLGIESVNQDSLNVIRKGLKPSVIERGVKCCQEAGLEVRGLFMLGLPKETPEKAKETIDFSIKLDLDYAQYTMTTPHKGTDFYADAKKYGMMLVEEESSRNTQNEAVYVPEGYQSAEELNNVVKYAYRKFYMRPRYWWKKIRSIRSFSDLNRYYQGFKISLSLINYRMENWKSDDVGIEENIQASLRSH